MSLKALRRADWIDEKRAKAYPVIFLLVYAFIAILWMSGSPLLPKHDGVEFARDFVNVYAAGQAVHEGNASDAYDWQKHKEREHVLEASGKGPGSGDNFVPWLYPPMFLAVAWLVAFLPYYGALAVYLMVGFGAYVASLLPLTHHKKAFWAVVAFPGVYSNLFAGQNGFITTALLAAGIFFLDTLPVAAGLFFGLLAYKPQFFVLIPLVLLVGRYWKALFATLASALASIAVSLFAFGLDPWAGFFRGLAQAQSTILENTGDRWLGIMHTTFSAVRMYGGSIQAAYVLQTLVAFLAGASVCFIWSKKPSLAVRGSSLVAALLLSSPYFFGYDEVLLAIPLALLVGEGVKKGFLPFEKLLLFALWLLPAFAKDCGEAYALPLTPPMLIGLLIFCRQRMSLSAVRGAG